MKQNIRKQAQAERLCYFLNEDYSLTKEIICFDFFSGFSKEQKEKSIVSFLETTAQNLNTDKSNILEICKTSPILLGQKLSAFQLKLALKNNQNIELQSNVERFFQGAKVFGKNDMFGNKEEYGPFEEIIYDPQPHPKRYKPLAEVLEEVKKGNLDLIHFQLFNENYPLKPKTFFYDYLYITALIQNKKLSEQLLAYKYFSDIEFNPKKSVNCQARSAAIYVSMCKKEILQDFIEQDNGGREKLNKEKFLQEYHNIIQIHQA